MPVSTTELPTYPDDLPGPEAGAKVTPKERRIVTAIDPGLFSSRDFQNDRSYSQDLTFTFQPAQAEAFMSWWTDDLLRGGSWFGATWPVPEGIVAKARRFVGKPEWKHIPGGNWQLAVSSEIMGYSAWNVVGGGGYHDRVGGGVGFGTGLVIITQPLDTTVIEGSTASFFVEARGTPPITYQWYKNGTLIIGATSQIYTTPATVLGDNNSVFTAVATNGIETVTSRDATLVVTAYGVIVYFVRLTSLSTLNVNTLVTATTGSPFLAAPMMRKKRGTFTGTVQLVSIATLRPNFNYVSLAGAFLSSDINTGVLMPSGVTRQFATTDRSTSTRCDEIAFNCQGAFIQSNFSPPDPFPLSGSALIEFLDINGTTLGSKVLVGSATSTFYTVSVLPP